MHKMDARREAHVRRRYIHTPILRHAIILILKHVLQIHLSAHDFL